VSSFCLLWQPAKGSDCETTANITPLSTNISISIKVSISINVWISIDSSDIILSKIECFFFCEFPELWPIAMKKFYILTNIQGTLINHCYQIWVISTQVNLITIIYQSPLYECKQWTLTDNDSGFLKISM